MGDADAAARVRLRAARQRLQTCLDARRRVTSELSDVEAMYDTVLRIRSIAQEIRERKPALIGMVRSEDPVEMIQLYTKKFAEEWPPVSSWVLWCTRLAFQLLPFAVQQRDRLMAWHPEALVEALDVSVAELFRLHSFNEDESNPSAIRDWGYYLFMWWVSAREDVRARVRWIHSRIAGKTFEFAFDLMCTEAVADPLWLALEWNHFHEHRQPPAFNSAGIDALHATVESLSPHDLMRWWRSRAGPNALLVVDYRVPGRSLAQIRTGMVRVDAHGKYHHWTTPAHWPGTEGPIATVSVTILPRDLVGWSLEQLWRTVSGLGLSEQLRAAIDVPPVVSTTMAEKELYILKVCESCLPAMQRTLSAVAGAIDQGTPWRIANVEWFGRTAAMPKCIGVYETGLKFQLVSPMHPYFVPYFSPHADYFRAENLTDGVFGTMLQTRDVYVHCMHPGRTRAELADTEAFSKLVFDDADGTFEQIFINPDHRPLFESAADVRRLFCHECAHAFQGSVASLRIQQWEEDEDNRAAILYQIKREKKTMLERSLGAGDDGSTQRSRQGAHNLDWTIVNASMWETTGFMPKVVGLAEATAFGPWLMAAFASL